MLSSEQKENKFWTLVQDEARRQGKMFFEDVGIGREIETDNLVAWDTIGWLIPLDKVELFRNAVRTSTHDTAEWDEFLVAEEFEIDGDYCRITFKNL